MTTYQQSMLLRYVASSIANEEHAVTVCRRALLDTGMSESEIERAVTRIREAVTG